MTALLLLVGALMPIELAAQTNTHAPRRYLLIIETSKAMDRRTSGLNKTVRKLLASELNGEAASVDSLGVWTFNEDLYTGKLPLQHFSPLDPTTVTTDVMAFIKKQKYEKNARWDPLLPALSHLVKNSPNLTVILFTAGLENVRGTPFDARINQAFNSWREQQQSAHMPVVTVLRARGGKLTDVAISAPPWAVEFPKLPPEIQIAKTTEPTSLAQPARTLARPLPMAAPLIVSGRKPQPDPIVIATNSAATAVLPNAPASTAQSPANGTGPETVDKTSSSAAPTTLSSTIVDAPSKTTAATSPVSTQAQGAPPSTSPRPETLASSSSSSKAEPTGDGSVTSSSPTSGSDTTTPVASAVTQPAPNWLPLVWLAGGGCIIFALLGIFVVWKRSQPTGQVSSITRSLERQPVPSEQSSSVDAR